VVSDISCRSEFRPEYRVVRKSGRPNLPGSRVAVVQEAPGTCGLASELTTTIQEESPLYQKAPIPRITSFDVPFPLYAPEDYYPGTGTHQTRY